MIDIYYIPVDKVHQECIQTCWCAVSYNISFYYLKIIFKSNLSYTNILKYLLIYFKNVHTFSNSLDLSIN